jgi:putative zinc finger protein
MGHVHDDLPALLTGELTPPVAAGVHAHLAVCDRCRLDLAAVAFAAGELRFAARLPLADPADLPPLLLEPQPAWQEPADGPRVASDLPAGAGRELGPAAVVLAATDDGLDPAYQATRQAAFAVAAREGSRVVLFDRSPELYLVDPYERARQVDGGRRAPSSLLNQRTASRLGRPYLAEQLAEASQLGLDGAAWVARGHGPDAIAAACEVLDVERVVLPATVATPALIDRVRGHTLAAFRRRVPARISLADTDGTLAEVD